MTLWEKTQELQKKIAKNQDLNKFSEHDIKNIYQDFIDCLTDHNHLYYIDSAPIISDVEYDELFTYLKKIEEYFPHIISSNSPTQNLIWQLEVQDWFIKANHETPLLSLENSYNAEDLYKREEKNKKIIEKTNTWTKKLSYYIEPKFDGISVELIYKDWILSQAITRGDGVTGEDITLNTLTIKNLPKKINHSWSLHLRGEIMMPKSQLNKLNKQRELNWKDPFANTRNATSWSIKLLDTNIVAKRWLVCYVYDILSNTDIDSDANIEKFWLPIFKLNTTTHKIESIQKIINICEDQKTKQNLDDQNLAFDGLVIKITDNNIRSILWKTAHHPRRAIAYKFPAEQISTQINSVDFQIGRTGIITPVANLEPVQLSWVTIARVSLHNFDFIKDKDIRIHDYVRLQRSGEVIPYITSIIKNRRDENKKTIQIKAPTTCPSCGKKTIQIDMHYYCNNTSCPAQIKEKLIHFASKDCMDIEWIWDNIIDILVDQNIVKNFADLYKITDPNIKLKIQWIPGFWSKKLFEISEQLKTSKNKPLRRLFNALGIPWVWKKIAQEISKALINENIKNYKQLKQKLSDRSFLENIYWIWEKIIDGIIDYLDINNNILENLESLGLNFSAQNHKQKNENNNKYNKKHFAITWSFPITRDQIIDSFESQWATFDNQPNKKTDFILIGEKAWNKKTKAQNLWIIIHEWRGNITKTFPFLKKITIKETTKSTWPVAQSLF